MCRIFFKRMLACVTSLSLTMSVTFAADIVIGQSAPLTGGNAELGNDIRRGANAYFAKINDAGGVNGNKIRLVTLDDKNDAKTAGENAKTLIQNEKAIALFGFASATVSLPAMPHVLANKVPFFAPFTGADTIRKQNDFVYTVRATYGDEIQKIINFWGPLGITRVLVLHYDDEVGRQNYQTVAKELVKFGQTPSALALKRNTDVTQDNIKALIQADPKIILATTLATPIVQISKMLQAINKPYPITSLSFASLSQITKGLGESAAGITVSLTVPAPNQRDIPVVAECQAAWLAAKEPGALSTTALEACIAAKVLVEALRKASNAAGKEPTRDSLQKALATLGRVDVGGFVMNFRNGFNHGGIFVDIAVIRRNGEVRTS
jgi:branched-chain amino acid transport system substrate-binding protein